MSDWYENLKKELGQRLMETWRRKFNLPAPKPKPTSETKDMGAK